MPVVLGIGSSHDASAAVYVDGRLAAAIAEERLSRVKCDGERLPSLAIDEVLRLAGLTRRDVTHIGLLYAFYPEEYVVRDSWLKEMERKVSRLHKTIVGAHPRGQFWVNAMLHRLAPRGKPFEPYFRTPLFLEQEGFRPDAKVAFFDHHLTHAVPAAYYAGFPECAVVVCDGGGDLWMNHTSGVLKDGLLTTRHVSDVAGTSSGYFYAQVTKLLGFTPMRHEGKVLGLAAFGDPKPLYEAFRCALRLAPDGAGFNSDFAGVEQAEDRRTEYLAQAMKGHSRENVAAAAQQVLEDAVVPLVRNFVRETGQRNLALNGGVFANVKLNQRLAALPEVDRLSVFPGMSDTGNSLGCALLMLEREQPGFVQRGVHALETVYWGPGYDDDAIRAELEARDLDFERLDPAALVERAAQAIHAGKVVGWFQGRMEFGPRALGNRSMVARPTDAQINKWLNERLNRTEFMPFAPSVLAEYAEAVFDNVPPARHPAEFMTVTFDVKREWQPRIPAVVHVDGTARPQLVRKDRNPLYWDLIDRYRQLSGIPLVLNTSFNVHEEPIVCGPREAVQALADNRVDCLAIGPFWLVA
jgi:carbamoyltransferase